MRGCFGSLFWDVYYITIMYVTCLDFFSVITVVDDWLARELSEAFCLFVVDMDLIVFRYSHTFKPLLSLTIAYSNLHDATVVIWGIIVPSLGIAYIYSRVVVWGPSVPTGMVTVSVPEGESEDGAYQQL